MADLIKLASTAVSYAIVGGSAILKAPQIIKILQNSSAEGISLPSIQLECLGYAIGTSWGIARGLDFKDYGEGLIVGVQLALLVALIGYYQRRLLTALSIFAVTLGLASALSMNLVPREVHQGLQGVQLVLLMVSRLPQMYTNYKRKSTGQLAFLTFFLALGGSAARVATTFLNVPWAKGKAMLLLQFSLSVLLNGIIIAQIWIYRHVKAGKKA